MGNPESFSDDLDSIFDELDSGAEPAVDAVPSATAAPAAPISLPELSLDDVPEPAFAISQQVAEFVPLNRRRARGNPALGPAEMERWLELREQLEYAFGAANPPLGGTKRRVLRVPTHLKVRLSGAAESLSALCNVSENGSFIELARPLAPGTSLELEIETGDGGPVLNVDACVRWCREIGNMDGPAGVGVEFTAIEDSDGELLQGIVERSLAAVAKKRD